MLVATRQPAAAQNYQRAARAWRVQDTAVVVNARFLAQTATGIHHYAQEICSRLRTPVRLERPAGAGRGVAGHLWEQTALWKRAQGALLWNPSATGPVFHRPHVTTVHDLGPFERPDLFAPSYVRFHRRIVTCMVRSARRVVTVSPASAERLQATLGVEPERIEVVPPGVTAVPRVGAMTLRAHLSRYGIRPGRFLLFVGTREPRKNLDMLIEAWKSVPARQRDSQKLVLAGPNLNPNVARSQTRASSGSGVTVLPYLDRAELESLYQGARALLFPSHYEGFGMPVLEAASRGCEVVASTAVPAARMISPGITVIPPTQREAWQSEIVRLVNSRPDRARLTRIGNATRAFTWDHAAAAMDAVLNTCRVQR